MIMTLPSLVLTFKNILSEIDDIRIIQSVSSSNVCIITYTPIPLNYIYECTYALYQKSFRLVTDGNARLTAYRLTCTGCKGF